MYVDLYHLQKTKSWETKRFILNVRADKVAEMFYNMTNIFGTQ